MHKHISSLHNPAIKRLLQLQEKSRTRKKEGLFIIEGRREISLALKGGYSIKEIYFNPVLLSAEEVQKLPVSERTEIVEISSEVYEKIAYRGSTEGVIAVAEAKDLSLKNVQLKNDQPLILIAEAPEKPGNIGALLRTADAAAVDAVFIANPRTDMFNPNIIRSSVGCVFTNQIAIGSTTEIIAFLKERKIGIFGAALQASVPYDTIDFTQASAIVVGTEATGLSEEWLENTTQNIIIPMQGEIDSMNVSVAAGILIFEANRQRRR
ncbi:RNA methyltransferase, TrmH family [Salinimicrobium catena]|uniref:RNA methyltransferase, TrmH family n=1 Tax=Salinimicrobium catena TaxID=390640 RepID=A0A1H5MNF1_9FLAO|nr:RNA methyltransferase [Salinimicrobium catena]SDL26794.1 RNA methyltransferase, TrmH family [Salinimicrobium catena]SEE90925.1 RNA methyltransferase, TrmH family [Salinimicrobium catena]